VERLEDHPLRQLYDAGVHVTINSDDPPMFGTDLNQEYEIAARLLDLDEAGLVEIAKNAVTASFLSDPDKRALAAEMDAYLAGWQG
jgi:aminodeoxyfutalosine deaminase